MSTAAVETSPRTPSPPLPDERGERIGASPFARAAAATVALAPHLYARDTANAEAEKSGPWALEPRGEGWAVVRPWNLGRAGEVDTPLPFATWNDLTRASLALAALPASGREKMLALEGQPTPDRGFAVHELGSKEVVGHLRSTFDVEFVFALNVFDLVIRDVASLSYLLEAAGEDAIVDAARLVEHRLGTAAR